MARQKLAGGDDDAALALTVATAFGSILVNIAQAMENQGASKQAEVLRGQRDHLIGVLSKWQKEYGDLKIRLNQRDRELESAHRGLAESRADARRLADELEALGGENRRLVAQLSKLERERHARK